MKILFVSPFPLTKKRGAAKVLLELGEALSKLGWQCQYAEPRDLAPAGTPLPVQRCEASWLRAYLKGCSGEFDVVEYDHTYLPYPRAEYAARTLMVARAQLLCHNLKLIKIPLKAGIKPWLGDLLYSRSREAKIERLIEDSARTLQESDLITLSNETDRKTLINCGISDAKIVVFPNGLSEERQREFEGIACSPPPSPRIAFVGTFDPRKGAREFPGIVRQLVREVPEIAFRLVGTAGMYPDANSVLAEFPKHLRRRLEVVPYFEPEALPDLLSDCSLGIFPSYVEGFPSGVLEMLAAALPVVAYDAPGLSMMLPERFLTRPGDGVEVARKVLALLKDASKLQSERKWAQARSRDFRWKEVAANVGAEYLRRLELKARKPSQAQP